MVVQFFEAEMAMEEPNWDIKFECLDSREKSRFDQSVELGIDHYQQYIQIPSSGIVLDMRSCSFQKYNGSP